MPTGATAVGTKTKATDAPKPVVPFEVYVRKHWDDGWEQDPAMRVVRVSDGACGHVTASADIWSPYGRVKHLNDDLAVLGTVPYEPGVDITGWWIRIMSVPSLVGAKVIFVGKVGSETPRLDGKDLPRTDTDEDDTIHSGQQAWNCYGPLGIIDRMKVYDSVWEIKDSADDEEPRVETITRVDSMNVRGKLNSLVGNRMDGEEKNADRNSFLYGGRTLWSRYEYLEYLVARIAWEFPDGSVQWRISNQFDFLKSMKDFVPFSAGMSYADMLKALIPSTLGIEFRIKYFESLVGGSGFEIEPFAMQPDLTPAGLAPLLPEGVTLPSDPSSVIIDAIEPGTKVSPQIANEKKYSKIVVMGKPIVVCCTLWAWPKQGEGDPNFENGSLVPKWTREVTEEGTSSAAAGQSVSVIFSETYTKPPGVLIQAETGAQAHVIEVTKEDFVWTNDGNTTANIKYQVGGLEQAYKQGAAGENVTAEDHDAARRAPQFRNVFQAYGAPEYWDFHGRRAIPKVGPDGHIVPFRLMLNEETGNEEVDPLSVGKQQRIIRDTLSWVPMLEGVDYSKSPIVDHNPSGTDPELIPPFAIVFSTEDQDEYTDEASRAVALLNRVGHNILVEHAQMSLSALQNDWGVFIQASPNLALALNHWGVKIEEAGSVTISPGGSTTITFTKTYPFIPAVIVSAGVTVTGVSTTQVTIDNNSEDDPVTVTYSVHGQEFPPAIGSNDQVLYDWQTLIATIAFESDERFRVEYTLPTKKENGVPIETDGSALIIEDEHAELWYIIPGTVVGIGTDGKVQRSGEDGIEVRNDREALIMKLIGAVARYAASRIYAKVEIKGLHPRNEFVGQMAVLKNAGEGYDDMKTPILGIEYDLTVKEGLTTLTCGYAREI